mmetsp:Transcript_112932/g.364560  ORF Transcript_112932/g.364560 Transcript_112932/m.364560 type:complete len:371 (-) Transcript_112932:245-1357(-)
MDVQQEPATHSVRTAERSTVFINEVEHFDPTDDRLARADDGARVCGLELPPPSQPEARQSALVRSYTRGAPLFSRVNRCLRDNDAREMHMFAGYICELRDVFRTDLPCRIVSPFKGEVSRGVFVQAEDLQAHRAFYQKDVEFTWPAFTSTSRLESVGKSFSNGLLFRIRCDVAASSTVALYAPADISKLSAFESESEVLFPPHVRFRVVDVQGRVIFLETMELPSVWATLEAERRAALEEPERAEVEAAGAGAAGAPEASGAQPKAKAPAAAAPPPKAPLAPKAPAAPKAPPAPTTCSKAGVPTVLKPPEPAWPCPPVAGAGGPPTGGVLAALAADSEPPPPVCPVCPVAGKGSGGMASAIKSLAKWMAS